MVPYNVFMAPSRLPEDITGSPGAFKDRANLYVEWTALQALKSI